MQYLVKPIVTHSGNSPLFSYENTRPNVGRTYAITSVKSKLVLTLSDGKLTQQKWTGSDNQKWKIIPLSDYSEVIASDGSYYQKSTCKIECVANGQVLDVPGSSTDNEVQIISYSWNGNPNQQWRLLELDGGVHRIENVNSGKVMDLSNASLDEGAAIQQFPSNNGDNQKWLLSEVTSGSDGALFEKKAIVYKNDNFNPPFQEIGPGTYDMGDLAFGNDEISSVRVPEGLRVIMYEDANFKGDKRMLYRDYDFWASGDSFNDKTSAILVEEVATFYSQPNYQGKKLILGIGRYDLTKIGGSAGTPEYGTGDFDINWDNAIMSMKVPSGLIITLYNENNFTGYTWVFNEDVPDLGQYKYGNGVPASSIVSSIIIKALGVVIPDNVLNFGDTISLKSDYTNRWLSANSNGSLQQQPQDHDWEKFEVIRAGDTQYSGIVSYGDIIALKSTAHNQYISAESNGNAKADRTSISNEVKFVVVRAGTSESNVFVSQGDKIALKSLPYNKYVGCQSSESNYLVTASVDQVRVYETFTIDSDSKPENTPDESGSVSSVCGLEACPNDICGAAACGAAAGFANVCGADACGVAACGVAGSLVSACGAAAAGIAACGLDFAGAGVSGASACGAAVSGIGACGADACGAAACGAAACGAAACGAAACGADACGADACSADASGIGGSGANACAADAGGVDFCGADACAANVCAINLCPADACAADACAIDIIPIIPGI
ncbi:Cys-every-fifth RiPP peptide CefA [Planktothricoides raciborskii]|uniref:Cys-every-fifth RiPP peptide CefA n=1 Tax=Planktothricoides raciborskii FACHB-1370 TaxID=2949576 RepID=A0ABR8EG97_9CYAN|nr:Cys-every-fifth RiPP peptide CefA [Planktothricoides raciborskii]MBD2544621.1 Cys-every-fifth RiPP peptide CefA [Planktothricoides raciborskii FACHB-1370]MBD2583566.1 Cys-every-fifth RiPP peptide CefA [Planktothricoides raciborskii FACHB-1261]